MIKTIRDLRALPENTDVSKLKGLYSDRGNYGHASLTTIDSGCELFKAKEGYNDEGNYDYEDPVIYENLPTTAHALADFLEAAMGYSIEGYKGGYYELNEWTDLSILSYWGAYSEYDNDTDVYYKEMTPTELVMGDGSVIPLSAKKRDK